MTFELTELPFEDDALEPYISARTIQYHYGKHHQGYVDKLNDAVEDTEWASKSLEEIIVAHAQDDGDPDIFNNAAKSGIMIFSGAVYRLKVVERPMA